jgi:RNA recognition motif-containing protein
MNIFVANLHFGMDDEQLRNVFSEFGQVESAKIIVDKERNQSKGFGFVEMADENEGNFAIESLNGKEFDGRPMTVKKALPKEERSNSGAGRRDNNRRSGGGGNGYGGNSNGGNSGAGNRFGSKPRSNYNSYDE